MMEQTVIPENTNTNTTAKLFVQSACIIIFVMYLFYSISPLLIQKADKIQISEHTPNTKFSKRHIALTEVLVRNRSLSEEFLYTMSLQRYFDGLTRFRHMDKNSEEMTKAKTNEIFIVYSLDSTDNQVVLDEISAAKQNNVISIADAERVIDAWINEYEAGRITKSDENKSVMTALIASRG